MRVLLFILAALMLLLSWGLLSQAKTSIHEIQAFVLGLIAAILFIGAAIVDAIHNAAEKVIGKISTAPSNPLPAPELPPLDPVMPAPAAKQDVKMGICPNCDTHIPLDSKECPKCKAQFTAGSAWRITPV